MRSNITLGCWSITLRSIVGLWLVLHLNHLRVLEMILDLVLVSLSIFLKFSPYDLLVVCHSNIYVCLHTLVHKLLQLFICEYLGWGFRFHNFNWWGFNGWRNDNFIAYISYCLDNMDLLLNLIRLIFLIEINLDSFSLDLNLCWRIFLFLDVVLFRS